MSDFFNISNGGDHEPDSISDSESDLPSTSSINTYDGGLDFFDFDGGTSESGSELSYDNVVDIADDKVGDDNSADSTDVDNTGIVEGAADSTDVEDAAEDAADSTDVEDAADDADGGIVEDAADSTDADDADGIVEDAADGIVEDAADSTDADETVTGGYIMESFLGGLQLL
jgi:hypothetical protein